MVLNTLLCIVDAYRSREQAVPHCLPQVSPLFWKDVPAVAQKFNIVHLGES